MSAKSLEHSSNCKNKVLMIAYHFPPDAAVGALRPQKFAKYLPEFGWEPHVLTIRKQYIEKCDETRLADVSGVNINRTSFWRTPLQLALDIRDRLRGYRAESTEKGISSETSKISTNESLGARLKRYFVALNWFPDDKLWWAVPAVVAGYITIRRERIRLIYATAPPLTTVIVGYLLSLLTGARLIVDMRDPWVVAKDPGPAHFRCATVDSWNRNAERVIMRRAQRVICTADNYRRELIAHYYDLPPEKFITITNGYDQTDFDSLHGGRSSKFVITYLGTFYLDRTPKDFFQALRQVILQVGIPDGEVEVRLIGQVKYAKGESVQVMIEQNGLAGHVRLMDFMPHDQAIQQMVSSDLLLLLAPNQTYQIPAKVFEYAGARRPILVLTDRGSTDNGATAEFVHSLNAGLVVPQDDVAVIAESLKVFYAERQTATRWYNSIDPSRYERHYLTSQLVQCFNEINTPGEDYSDGS